MDISRRDEFNSIAANMVHDVCAYYMLKFHGKNASFTTLWGKLYSYYGQRMLIQGMDGLPAEFFHEVENNKSLRRIDNRIYDEIVADIIEKSKWADGTHAGFYETCAKIIIFGQCAMDQGALNREKLFGEIAKFVKEACAVNMLDEKYDQFRINAHSVVFTVFKYFGTDVRNYVPPVERELGGFNEIRLVGEIKNKLYSKITYNLKFLSTSKSLQVMNREKFCEVTRFMWQKLLNNTNPLQYSKVYLLCFHIASISLYSVKHSYAAGVQQGIDLIVQLTLAYSFQF